jgi:hypothetical protein
MDDSIGVGMIQGGTNLASDGNDPPQILGPVGMERAALDQLHHNKE